MTYGVGRAERIVAHFGRNGQNVLQSIVATGIEFPVEWRNDQENRAFDFAAVQLSQAASEDFAPLVFGDAKEELLRDMRVCIAGYPVDTKKRKFNKSMYMHSGQIRDIEDQKLDYQIDTSAGESGAPLIYYNKEKLTNVVIGIHNSGSEAAQRNTAARINSVVFAKLREWQSRG